MQPTANYRKQENPIPIAAPSDPARDSLAKTVLLATACVGLGYVTLMAILEEMPFIIVLGIN